MAVINGIKAIVCVVLVISGTVVVNSAQSNANLLVAMKMGEQYEIYLANKAAPYRKLQEIIQLYGSEGSKGQTSRKASFSAKVWPTDANNFIRIRRDDVPILTTPDLTAPKATLVLAKKDEVFQFISEWFNVKLNNPLAYDKVFWNDGDWYKVKLLDGREGWVLESICCDNGKWVGLAEIFHRQHETPLKPGQAALQDVLMGVAESTGKDDGQGTGTSVGSLNTATHNSTPALPAIISSDSKTPRSNYDTMTKAVFGPVEIDGLRVKSDDPWIKFSSEVAAALVEHSVGEARTAFGIQIVSNLIIILGKNLPDEVAKTLLLSPQKFVGWTARIVEKDTSNALTKADPLGFALSVIIDSYVEYFRENYKPHAAGFTGELEKELIVFSTRELGVMYAASRGGIHGAIAAQTIVSGQTTFEAFKSVYDIQQNNAQLKNLEARNKIGDEFLQLRDAYKSAKDVSQKTEILRNLDNFLRGPGRILFTGNPDEQRRKYIENLERSDKLKAATTVATSNNSGALQPNANPGGQGSPAKVLGVWTGSVHQLNAGTYPVVMTINATQENSYVGIIEYSSLGCGGRLIFVAGSTGNQFIFNEKIEHGNRKCVDGGSIHLGYTAPDTITWEWFYPNGTRGVYGTLTREETPKLTPPASIKQQQTNKKPSEKSAPQKKQSNTESQTVDPNTIYRNGRRCSDAYLLARGVRPESRHADMWCRRFLADEQHLYRR